MIAYQYTGLTIDDQRLGGKLSYSREYDSGDDFTVNVNAFMDGKQKLHALAADPALAAQDNVQLNITLDTTSIKARY